MSLKIDSNSPVYQLYNITNTYAANSADNNFLLGSTTKSADGDLQNNGNPSLEKPDAKFDPFAQLTTFTAPSFGASVLSLITETNAEQRQAAREQKALQTEAQVANIMEQADVMREKAVTQLCIGVATGMLSITQGIASTAITAKGIKSIDDAFDADGALKPGATSDFATRQNAETMLNTRVQAFNSSMGGVSNIMGSITQTVGGFYDAEITELQAQQERMKAMQDSLDSLEQALKETLQKALSTQDSIQQNINQTRTKILG